MRRKRWRRMMMKKNRSWREVEDRGEGVGVEDQEEEVVEE